MWSANASISTNKPSIRPHIHWHTKPVAYDSVKRRNQCDVGPHLLLNWLWFGFAVTRF